MSQPKPLVVLLCYYFPPANEIGAARPDRFYRYLRSAGYDCRVITASAQNSPSPPDVITVPDHLGEVWNGHARFTASVRSYAEIIVRKSLLPGGVGLSWALDAAAACARVINEAGRPAVLISSFPPVGVMLGALMAARQGRLSWIADFRDPMAFGSTHDMHGPISRGLHAKMESLALKRSSAVIANTRSMGARWRQALGPAGGKVHVIWNGFDAQDRPYAKPLASPNEIQLVHVGSLYHGRNPNLIVASLDRLRRRGAAKALKTRLLLVGAIGSGAGLHEELSKRAIGDGWLELKGAVSKSEARTIGASAHGQVLLQPGTTVQVPGKVFEYVCIGRPILAVTPRASDTEYLLQNSGVPYVSLYADDSPDDVDEKLLRYLDIPPDPVPFSPWFEENFEMRKQGAQLAEVIASVT